MKTIIVLFLLTITAINVAHGAPNICYSTSGEIKRIYPDDSAKFTHYMKGHRNEKCWYAASLGFEHDRRGDTVKPKKSPPTALAKATPAEVPVAAPPPPTDRAVGMTSLMPRKFEDDLYRPTVFTPADHVLQGFAVMEGWK